MKSHLKHPVQTNTNLRPFDEPLFCAIGKHRPEIMEDFMRVLLNDDSIEFKDSAVNIIPASITPDNKQTAEFIAYTKNDTVICFITDSQNEEEMINKVKWYRASRIKEYAGEDLDSIQSMILVILMEKDAFGYERPFYVMDSKLEYSDKTVIFRYKQIYVNSEYGFDDPLGSYIHDFMCDDIDDMRIDSIKEAVKYFESIGE